MGLDEYREKRRFDKTPEPPGRKGPRRRKNRRFVVHKHAATHLHYDLRLEMDGVYTSFAVPKGPSLDPREKRLAVHVEDHPLDYGNFEGVIPEGEYGAGTVMIWDRGRFEPLADPARALEQGELKFELHGEKLKGAWVLVRIGSGPAGRAGRDWLLIKEQDDAVRSADSGDVLVEQPRSVESGRSLEEIRARPDQVWSVRESRAESSRGGAKERAVPDASNLVGARPGELPDFVEPQLAKLSDRAPDGSGWLHEIKYDGYRFLARIDRGRATFLTRNGFDWTERVPSLAAAAAELPVETALLDGEVVFLEPSGTTNFQALQNSFRRGQSGSLVYLVFDLLHLDGVDLTGVPLETRKATLAEFLATDEGRIRYSDHLVGNGREFFRQAAKLSLEGIVSKRRDRPYRPGRGDDWRKIKCIQRQEFVIGGYTAPAGARKGLSALLLGVFEDGGLEYAGRVGTGFTDESLEDLRERLDAIARETSPFRGELGDLARAREVRFAEPKLVANIEFTSWTEAGHLRHPTFRGLREDLEAADVHREGGGTDTAADDLSHLQALSDFYMTNPDRLLWPEQGITKLALASMYASIHDWILPHLTGRPLSLLRHPEGYHREGFFQKHASEGMPEGLFVEVLEDEGGEEEEVLYIEDVVGLMALVQLGVLEIHPWGSRLDRPDRPDRVFFDLDPDPSVTWGDVIEAALRLRERLDELGLVSFVKTTGGKGLHLLVPLARRHDWNEVRRFARAVARDLAAASPSRFTLSPSKSERKGKIYVDTARNGRGATVVGAYSTRARAGAPMSVPLSWDELHAGVRSDHFTVTNIRRRIASVERDPWADVPEVRQGLTRSIRQALGI